MDKTKDMLVYYFQAYIQQQYKSMLELLLSDYRKDNLIPVARLAIDAMLALADD